MDTALITLDTIRNFRKVPANFDEVRLAGFIYDVQISNLRGLIGAELYRDVLANYDPDETDEWKALVEGDAAAGFYGLWPFLAYHVLALIAREANTSFTEKGLQTFSNAETSESRDRALLENEYKTKAGWFGYEIIDYLEANKSTYTSYVSTAKPAADSLNWIIV